MLNIESVQQTLNLTLDSEYIHVFVPVEALITQTNVSEEANTQTLLLAEGEQSTNTSQETSVEGDDEQAANNGGRVRAYLVLHPGAKVREVAEALAISVSTANKWMSRVKS